MAAKEIIRTFAAANQKKTATMEKKIYYAYWQTASTYTQQPYEYTSKAAAIREIKQMLKGNLPDGNTGRYRVWYNDGEMPNDVERGTISNNQGKYTTTIIEAL